MKSLFKRRLSLLEAVAIAGFLLVFLFGFVYHFRMSSLNERLDAKLAELRRRGWPTTLEELNAYYPCPDGENAADIYLEACSKLDFSGCDMKLLPLLGNAELPDTWEEAPLGMEAEIKKSLMANREALTLISKAAKVKGCRYPGDLAKPERRHLGSVRYFACLLLLDSALAVGRGDSARAAKDVMDTFAIARSLDNEPLMISSLVSLACEEIALEELRRMLGRSRTSLNPDELKSFQECLAGVEKSLSIERVMIGEGCFIISNFGNAGPLSILGTSPLSLSSALSKIVSRALSVIGVKTEAKLRFIDLWEASVAAAQKEPEEECKSLKALDSMIVSSPKTYRAFWPYLRYSAIGRKHVEMVAKLRAARAALAIERFRMEKGRLPESLGELAPEYMDAIPADPFSSGPLKYKKGLLKCRRDEGGKWMEKDGFAVYSVGSDGIDNGAEGCLESREDVCFPVILQSLRQDGTVSLTPASSRSSGRSSGEGTP